MVDLAYVLPGVVLPSTIVGGAIAMYHAYKIANTEIAPSNGERNALINGADNESESQEMYQRIKRIQGFIAAGANAFLAQEYKILAVFVVVFAAIIATALAVTRNTEHVSSWAGPLFSTISFFVGAVTSVLSGYLGMRIAVTANARVSIAAKDGYAQAFNTAFHAGMVMGFGLTSLGLLVLYIIATAFKAFFWELGGKFEAENTVRLCEAIAGYGLGGSAIALFARVGGGIYTKAADVGADLSGKVIEDFPEDDPRNPAVIADCTGDNVGDIAGMGADLFGSLAEGSCAAMVIAANTKTLNNDWVALNLPLVLLSASILGSLVVAFLIYIRPVSDEKRIEQALKVQLIASTVLMTFVSGGVIMGIMPSNIEFFVGQVEWKVANYLLWVCVLLGLWTGLGIGLITEYFTSFTYQPVKDLANACSTGAATNIIYGLALGYKSTILPVVLLSLTILISHLISHLYGIALAALGVLSNIATALTIDAYGPICDNAGGIAEMCNMPSYTRDRTDNLDAAGNTTAAIGKGGAIASAILVGLALFGAFVRSANLSEINLLEPYPMAGVLFGSMIPYWFSALCMRSVGDAAHDMVKEVQRQLDINTNEGRLIRQQKQDPDYARCVAISTDASLREMRMPGALVIVTPLLMGFVFGTRTLAGFLIGNIVSGTQVAISASNSGGAWDNAKKYLGTVVSKTSEEFKASVVGDTVGDPLKDTSGPAVNILIKLSAIISVVFGPAFPALNESPVERLVKALGLQH